MRVFPPEVGGRTGKFFKMSLDVIRGPIGLPALTPFFFFVLLVLYVLVAYKFCLFHVIYILLYVSTVKAFSRKRLRKTPDSQI